MLGVAGRAPESDANGPEQQRLVDEVKAELRNGTAPRPSIFKQPPPRPAPSTDPLDHRMVEEIECIRRHLDLLGNILANDLVLVRRYGTQLQSIDLINQLLGHLGDVIGAESKLQAVERITLQELRARLKRRPLASLSAKAS